MSDTKSKKLEVQLRVKHSGKYLNIPGSSKDDGVQAIQWPHENSDNSTFEMQEHSSGWEITAKHSGKVLASDGDDGIVIQTTDKDGHKRQRWHIKHNDDGTVVITNVHNGKAINVPGSSQTNGEKLILWDYGGGDNEKWFIESRIPQRAQLRVKHSGLYLNVPASSKDDDTQLIQWPHESGDNSTFLFKDQKDGTYEIVAKHSEKAIGADEDDKIVIQTTSKGHKSQRWQLKRQSDGSFGICNVHSGKGINIPGSSKKNGEKVILWDFSGSANEVWFIEAV